LLSDDITPQRLRRSGRHLRCSCLSPSYSHSKYWIGPLVFFRHKTGSHNSKCPLASLALRTESFKLRLLSSKYVLAGILEFSFSLMKGAGGLSIAPSLSYRGILSDGDFAVRILKRYPSRFARQAYCDRSIIITETIQHLNMAFEDQKSSPWATDLLGNNILHINHFSRSLL
jgi:hypothetical protein